MASPRDHESAGFLPEPGAPGEGASWTLRSATAPAGTPDPAEIRAIAFAASLGPQHPPYSSGVDDNVIDLAGEEALVEFLMRITPVDVD